MRGFVARTENIHLLQYISRLLTHSWSVVVCLCCLRNTAGGPLLLAREREGGRESSEGGRKGGREKGRDGK